MEKNFYVGAEHRIISSGVVVNPYMENFFEKYIDTDNISDYFTGNGPYGSLSAGRDSAFQGASTTGGAWNPTYSYKDNQFKIKSNGHRNYTTAGGTRFYGGDKFNLKMTAKNHIKFKFEFYSEKLGRYSFDVTLKYKKNSDDEEYISIETGRNTYFSTYIELNSGGEFNLTSSGLGADDGYYAIYYGFNICKKLGETTLLKYTDSSNNVDYEPRKVIKAYIGNESNKPKNIKSMYIGNENNKPVLFYSPDIMNVGSQSADYKYFNSSDSDIIGIYSSGSLKFNNLQYKYRGAYICLIGGGGGGAAGLYYKRTSSAYWSNSGCGGGGGYVKTQYIDIEKLNGIVNITIGEGGDGGNSLNLTDSADGKNGGKTSIEFSDGTSFNADGGTGGGWRDEKCGIGGSGGGYGYCYNSSSADVDATNGFYNGNGYLESHGQKMSTRIFNCDINEFPMYSSGGSGGNTEKRTRVGSEYIYVPLEQKLGINGGGYGGYVKSNGAATSGGDATDIGCGGGGGGCNHALRAKYIEEYYPGGNGGNGYKGAVFIKFIKKEYTSKFYCVGEDSGYSKLWYLNNGKSWIPMTGLKNTTYRSVAYGNGRFVCVGNNGSSYCSTDGKTWKQMTGLKNITCYSVTYGNGRFVCVGDSASYYSTDGKSWSNKISSSIKWCRGIAYGNGRFVCVGDGGRSYYSTDGTKWTAINGLEDFSNYHGITYANGKFVCVGTNGVSFYLSDAGQWVAMAGLEETRGYYGVTYGNGRFVCVGDNGDSYYSIDGKTWHYMLDSKFSVRDIVYGNERFVCVGNGGASYCLTNELIWIDSGFSISDSLNSVVHTNKESICVGNKGKSYYSTDEDRKEWTAMDGLLDYDFYSVAYGNGKFVCVGERYAYYSTDGKSWSRITNGLNFSNYFCYSVTYGNGQFVCVGNNGKSYYSTNGTSWKSMTGLSEAINYRSVTYGNGQFVCVGDGGNSYYSIDGKTWIAMNGLNSNDNIKCVSSDSERFVCAGNNGKSYYSTDGKTWQPIISLSNINYKGMTSNV